MVTCAEVRACSFEAWYEKFEEDTFPSEIISLPQEFVDYLLSDGVYATKDSDNGKYWQAEVENDPEEIAKWAEVEQEDADSGEEEEQQTVASFPELESEVNKALDRLGGAALPKLNWSAPKDAVWVSSDGSLRCTNAQEVFMLLKCSDSATYDLCHAFDNCEDAGVLSTAQPDSDPDNVQGHQALDQVNEQAQAQIRATSFKLVLRKWYSLEEALQFRCFVGEGELLAISQREVSRCYGFLQSMSSEIRWKIDRFFEDKIRPHFDQSHYVFDVYITRKGSVRLVDFNTWGGATLPLLFSWEELEVLAFEQHKEHDQDKGGSTALRQLSEATKLEKTTLAEDDEEEDGDAPVLRIVQSCEQVLRPSLRTGVPIDLVDPQKGGALDELYRKMREQAQAELAEEGAEPE